MTSSVSGSCEHRQRDVFWAPRSWRLRHLLQPSGRPRPLFRHSLQLLRGNQRRDDGSDSEKHSVRPSGGAGANRVKTTHIQINTFGCKVLRRLMHERLCGVFDTFVIWWKLSVLHYYGSYSQCIWSFGGNWKCSLWHSSIIEKELRRICISLNSFYKPWYAYGNFSGLSECLKDQMLFQLPFVCIYCVQIWSGFGLLNKTCYHMSPQSYRPPSDLTF